MLTILDSYRNVAFFGTQCCTPEGCTIAPDGGGNIATHERALKPAALGAVKALYARQSPPIQYLV